MTKRNVIIGGAIGAVAVVLGFAFWLGFFSDTPEEATIEAAVAAVSGDETSDADSTDTATTDAEPTNAETANAETVDVTTNDESTDIDGEWTVQANADATFIGYRIDEVLNTIGDFEVVGRTSDVSGTIAIDGTTITDVSVVAQMGTLTTDNSQRDRAMRNQALETEQFPEATFSLTTPILLDSVPADGVTIEVIATGDLTIHGVTQSVDFPLEAQRVGDAIVVVGQLPVLLADFDISAPRAPVVASVSDNALLELSIVLAK